MMRGQLMTREKCAVVLSCHTLILPVKLKHYQLDLVRLNSVVGLYYGVESVAGLHYELDPCK